MEKNIVINILKIHDPDEIKNGVLNCRIKRASSNRSIEFVAVINDVESGLLSYEDWSDKKLGFIYEIFVLPDFRSQGIGSELLSYAEALAIQYGCVKIQLKAHALDEDTKQEMLVSWYIRKGYFQEIFGGKEMEKILLPRKP